MDSFTQGSVDSYYMLYVISYVVGLFATACTVWSVRTPRIDWSTDTAIGLACGLFWPGAIALFLCYVIVCMLSSLYIGFVFSVVTLTSFVRRIKTEIGVFSNDNVV